MKPSHPSAFHEPDQPNSKKRSVKQLSTPALSSMTASMQETEFGWTLNLSPMRAFDALRIWPVLTKVQNAQTLLYDVTVADHSGASSLRNRAVDVGISMSGLAEHLGVPIIEHFSDDALVLDDLSLRELVGMVDCDQIRSVLIEGPIEERDAAAIIRTAKSDINPLAVEFRAVAAMSVRAYRHITLYTRNRLLAIRLVAENFRHYLGAIKDQPFDEFSSPELWQLERLFDLSGALIVRPIETDIYSGSIDVGISTASPENPNGLTRIGPADKSLIYDLPSRTWHDEP